MAEINNSDITTGALNGDGSFDLLMASVNRHLLEEFSKNRIKGTDYSNVYLGAMQSVMAQAMQFQLERQAADKQAELLGKQVELIDVQIIGAIKDNELKDKQMEKMDAEISIMRKQELKLDQDILVAKEQVLVMKQQVLKSKAEVINLGHQGNVLIQQIAKIQAEAFLLTEKKWSEQAQRLNKVNGQDVVGVIGAQRGLYIKQTEGFDRSAEQKAAKMAIDTWNVRRTTQDAEPPISTLNNDNLDIIMKSLIKNSGLDPVKSGVNIPPDEGDPSGG